MQMLVYGGQVAFDATVQTLEAHYACTNNLARPDNAAPTDNRLRMIHSSVQIYTDNNTRNLQRKGRFKGHTSSQNSQFYKLQIVAETWRIVKEVISCTAKSVWCLFIYFFVV